MKPLWLAGLAALFLQDPSADDLAKRALHELQEKRYPEAAETATDAIRLDPSLGVAYLIRATARTALDDLPAAAADAKTALKLDASLYRAYQILGEVSQQDDQFSEAIDWYTKYLEQDPEEPRIYGRRASAKAQAGDYEGAFADCARGLSRNPDDGECLFQRAFCLMATGRWNAAIPILERSLNAAGTFRWHEEAVALLPVIRNIPERGSPRSPSTRLLDQVKSQLGDGNQVRAAILLEAVVRMNGSDADAHEMLARLYLADAPPRSKRWKRARYHLYSLGFTGQGVPPDLRPQMKALGSTVLAALIWLADHQSPDGRWSTASFADFCHADAPPVCQGRGTISDARSTSLAILAFLGAGYSPLSHENYGEKPFATSIRDALAWLIAHPETDDVTDRALGTLALSEAAGTTAILEYQAPARTAVERLLQLRLNGGGWPALAGGKEPDVRATGWALLALRSAKLSDFSCPEDAVKESVTWLMTGDGGEVTDPIIATACARLHRRHEFKPISDAVTKREAGRPTAEKAEDRDAVREFFRTVAVAWGPDLEAWSAWTVPSRKALVAGQNFGGRGTACASGSWAPGSRADLELGPVALTALHAVCLEACYGYANNLVGVPKEPK